MRRPDVVAPGSKLDVIAEELDISCESAVQPTITTTGTSNTSTFLLVQTECLPGA